MNNLFRRIWFLGLLFIFPLSSFAQTGGGEQRVVIQKKTHTKNSKIEFSILGGVVPNNPFITYIPLELRAAFHFTEGFGLEIGGGYYPPVGSEKDYTGPIKNPIVPMLKNNPHYLGVHIFEQQSFFASLDFLWTPIFGKMEIFGANAIAYWEIAFQLGGGITGVYNEERSGRFATDEKNPIKIRPTINFGATMRFWLTHWLILKLDIRDNFFQKQVGKGGLSQHLTVMLGLSVII